MSIEATLIAPPQLAALQAAEPVVVIDTRDADTFADTLGKAGLSGAESAMARCPPPRKP